MTKIARRVLPVWLLLNAACHSPRKPLHDISKDKPSIRSSSLKNKEYIDRDSIKINGGITMVSDFHDVVNVLGNPDSTGELSDGINGSFYQKKFRYCYFKGLTFEKYGDTLVFSEIKFDEHSPAYFSTADIRLDNTTTDKAFARRFPYSFENNQMHGTSMDKYEYLFLPASRLETKDEWDFTFDVPTGKLLSISYADPTTPHRK